MNADYDYKAFLDDIEEDAEIRANVNKYKDEEVIEELLGKLSLNPTEEKLDVKKSPMLDALDKGEAGHFSIIANEFWMFPLLSIGSK